MKHLYLFAIVSFLFISCGKKEEKKEPLYPESVTETKQTPEALGQEIFDGKGNCYTCHKPDQKTIGPSLQDIATIYKEKGGDIVSFLRGNEKPLVDPSQYEVMKTNFIVTKAMSDDELRGLEAYIYSFKK